jgi:hypothetical protein
VQTEDRARPKSSRRAEHGGCYAQGTSRVLIEGQRQPNAPPCWLGRAPGGASWRRRRHCPPGRASLRRCSISGSAWCPRSTPEAGCLGLAGGEGLAVVAAGAARGLLVIGLARMRARSSPRCSSRPCGCMICPSRRPGRDAWSSGCRRRSLSRADLCQRGAAWGAGAGCDRMGVCVVAGQELRKLPPCA